MFLNETVCEVMGLIHLGQGRVQLRSEDCNLNFGVP
jgi:hypothetical protein